MTDFLLSPLTWLFGSLALAAWSRRGPLRHVAIATAVVASLLTTPFGANALVGTVENRAWALVPCTGDFPAALVVLGGGVDHEPRNASDAGALSGVSMRRLLAGVAFYRTHPGTRMYFAGASPYATPESALMAQLAEQLGVPGPAITKEIRSTTTWSNAQNLKGLAPNRIWLVTSALHMDRAALAFHAAGFSTCPVISDHDYLPPDGIGYFLPRTSALRKANAAIHELVGDLAYRWRARTPQGETLSSRAAQSQKHAPAT